MHLYVTLGSRYARMARIVVIEKRLESRVEVIVGDYGTRGGCVTTGNQMIYVCSTLSS